MQPKPISQTSLWMNCKQGYRRGVSYLLVSVAVIAVSSLGGSAYYFIGNTGGGDDSFDGKATYTVESKKFEYFVSEKGEVQSTSNVEVRCYVKSKGSAGTAILKIVPEGTHVNKGEFLIEFDASLLKEELTQQEIAVANGEQAVTQAKNELETAIATFREYTGLKPTDAILKDIKNLTDYGNGTFRQELDIVDSEIFVAEENMRRSEEYVQYSQRMAAKGYVTAVQLEADRFAVDKAKKELDVAKSKYSVLLNFTYKKMVGQLAADIAIKRGNLKSAKIFHGKNVLQRDELNDQIDKCRVLAPTAGQVVYDNQTDRHGNNDFTVVEGAVVRENQVVIRLPDPTKMEVKTVVQETRINSVKEDATCMITLDAMPGAEFNGIVEKVDAYPIAESRWTRGGPKKYNTYVTILDSIPKLKSGQRAQVKIFVHRAEDVLQVPVQSVVTQDKQSYCIVHTDKGWERVAIEKGIHNEKNVIITKGLQVGDVVSMTPRQLLDELDLPQDEKSATASKSNKRKNRHANSGQASKANQATHGGGG